MGHHQENAAGSEACFLSVGEISEDYVYSALRERHAPTGFRAVGQKRELPRIGEKTEKIIEGPYLLGVTGLSGVELGLDLQLVTLTVNAIFHAQDEQAVKVFLNREIRLLFEREGIELL